MFSLAVDQGAAVGDRAAVHIHRSVQGIVNTAAVPALVPAFDDFGVVIEPQETLVLDSRAVGVVRAGFGADVVGQPGISDCRTALVSDQSRARDARAGGFQELAFVRKRKTAVQRDVFEHQTAARFDEDQRPLRVVAVQLSLARRNRTVNGISVALDSQRVSPCLTYHIFVPSVMSPDSEIVPLLKSNGSASDAYAVCGAEKAPIHSTRHTPNSKARLRNRNFWIRFVMILSSFHRVIAPQKIAAHCVSLSFRNHVVDGRSFALCRRNVRLRVFRLFDNFAAAGVAEFILCPRLLAALGAGVRN